LKFTTLNATANSGDGVRVAASTTDQHVFETTRGAFLAMRHCMAFGAKSFFARTPKRFTMPRFQLVIAEAIIAGDGQHDQAGDVLNASGDKRMNNR